MKRIRAMRRRRAAYLKRMRAMRRQKMLLARKLKAARRAKVVKAAPVCSTCAAAPANVTMEQKTIVANKM